MTKAELEAVRAICSRLERQKELLKDKLASGGISVCKARERIKGGETNDVYKQIDHIYSKIEEISRELEEEKVILKRKLAGIRFSYEVEQTMHYFYIDCYTIEQIAKDFMRYSTRTIDRYLGDGRKLSCDVVACH